MHAELQLSEREAAVLAQVVSCYLETAAPVGSQAIVETLARTRERLSSASIRGIMADLEAAGLLTHPHTSAGRVPTSRGLRHYVDCLIETEPLSAAQWTQVSTQYAAAEPELGAVLQETTRLLGQLSHYAGIVATPAPRDLVFRHMEFVQLASRRLLGIFVTQEGVTQNRVIDTEREWNYAALERINNYCNAAFVGLTLVEARQKAARELASTEAADEPFGQAMQYAEQVLAAADDAAVMIDGGSRLLAYPEFAEATRAQPLLQAFEDRRTLAALLERAEQSAAVQVYIGQESGYDALADCSVVVSPYHRGQTVLGTLGVIGPTRMAYGRVIPIVQCTAAQVTRWLEQQ